MRALPAQSIHRPYGSGPYRMAMDLVTVPESRWFEIDDRYAEDIAEKRRLLAEHRAEVFAALPESDAARAETLAMVTATLTRHHPDWFPDCRRDAAGQPIDPGLDPLEQASLLVQEDLCLIQDGPVFTAASLCFPSRWLLADKIGKNLAAVHGPVPLYADRLARPVDRFMRHLKTGAIGNRLNWSLLDDPALFQPSGKWRSAERAITDPGQEVFLRVERQTLRRLPLSGAVLFGIRVHVYPLARVVDGPARAATLAAAIRALPPEIQHYKSLLPFRTPLLVWLDRLTSG